MSFSSSSSFQHPAASPPAAGGLGSTLRFVLQSDRAKAPVRGSAGAAGFDLSAAESVIVSPGARACVSTGLQVGIPLGCYGRIAPRSGLALRHGIDIGGGVIDADYRGIVGVIVFNFSLVDFKIAAGDCIAQLVLEKISDADAVQVDVLENTPRGRGGFGSTGV